MLKQNALTTVDRFKTYAGITTSANDTLIENLINTVTQVIENYTHRKFKKATYSDEVYSGSDSENLILQNYPVTSVTRVQVRSGEISDNSWSTISTNDYLLSNVSGIITRKGSFSSGVGNYRVSYVAGYDYDNVNTFLGDTQAADIEWVAWELIKKAYTQRTHEEGVEQVRLGDASITYKTNMSTSIFSDPWIKNILDSHKRVVVA